MRLLSFSLLVIITTEFASCQTKPLKILFEITQLDTATGLEKTKIYKLIKQAENADFDYPKLDDITAAITDTLTLRNVMPIFEPVNGQYNYYQFIATFKGKGYNGDQLPKIEDFHDILIIKTKNDGEVVDAYQYTLEWSEVPLQYDLYKSSVKGIVLANNLDILKLRFVKTYGGSEDNQMLKENGNIKLK